MSNTFGTTFGTPSSSGFSGVSSLRSIVTAAGTTTGASTDGIVVFTGSTTQTYNLPSCTTGKVVIVKNRSTGIVTVARSGSDTIDGGTSSISLSSGDGVILIGNSTDWVVI